MTIPGRIRVCHLVSDDAWGGAESVVAGLLRAQAQRPDLDVQLIALNPGRLVKLATELGLAAQVAPEAGRGFAALLSDVNARIATLRPQIVHSHRYKENLLSYLVARRHGARSVVTLHGEEAPARRATRLALAARYFLMHRLARLVGTRFAAVSSDLRARFRMSPARCVVIPNGVSVPPAPARETHANGGTLVIGWVGRLVPIKNLPILLEAMVPLAARFAAARLLLVGEGPEHAALAAHADRLGIADRVELAGFVDEPARALARMDVFALPSLHEGLPVALLEAMAAGLPCVAASVGGIPEVDGGAGAVRLVASHAPEDWAAALGELLASPTARAALGARGRARIAERFSIEAVVEQYVALYRSALAGGFGMIRIFVDADACPVKDEVYVVATRYGVPVTLVANARMHVPRGFGAELVVVDGAPDAADDWIAQRAQANDVIVTSDIPLAARCLAVGARALGSDGRPFDEDSIGDALATRDLKAWLRETGVAAGGPRALAAKDRSRFLSKLDELVQRSLRERGA